MPTTDIYWKALWTVGMEHLILQETPAGIDADGVVLAHYEGRGLRVSYHIHCNTAWCVQRIDVKMQGEKTFEASLAADGKGRWRDLSGKMLGAYTGCIDVDIMSTPFTNTLPIRRLGLEVGQSEEIEVVYCRIPTLKIEKAAQRYTCLAKTGGKTRYLYESLGSDFKAELLVDETGLVIDYQNTWERLEAPAG